MRLRISGVKLALLGLGLVLVVLSACSTQSASQTAPAPTQAAGASQAATKGDATAGKTLFDTNCAGCHGANAAGGQQFGDVKAADIRGPALQAQLKGDPATIRAAILNGKKADGSDLNQAMPRWQGKLTEAQSDDIVAYLMTLK